MKKAICTYVPAIAILSAVLVTGAVAQQLEAPASVRENNQATRDVLQESLSIDFFETRFGDVMKFLGEQTDLQFILHESAYENNVDEDQLLTLTLEDTRIATCLDIMLEPYQCTYAIQDGIVVFMSEDAILDRLTLRVFDCKELLAAIHPKRSLVEYGFARNAANAGGFRGGSGFGGGGRGGLSGGVFRVQQDPTDGANQAGGAGDAIDKSDADQDDALDAASGLGGGDSNEPRYRTVEANEQLVELIQQMVDPDSWEENGGTARIYEINGMIIVSQTEKNLREIDSLLAEIAPQMK